jgi:4-amino-4-deoxychorismate lyase
MILVNGAATNCVPAMDRGLAYGDGVFRTLRVRKGRMQSWPRHFRKLVHDCLALGLPGPEEASLWEELARALHGTQECVAKIIVTRGSGERGYAPERVPRPTRIVMTGPQPQYPEEYFRSGIKARLCTTRLSAQPRLAGIKHLNRLENVLARAEWDDSSVAEGLMLDQQLQVVGGTMTSLFIVEEEGLVAPDLVNCGVDGVTRERVFEAAARQGLPCRIGRLTLDRVLEAREVFLGNSVIGIWPVRECAGKVWRPGRETVRIQLRLDEEGD